eukprot:sb/3475195/
MIAGSLKEYSSEESAENFIKTVKIEKKSRRKLRKKAGQVFQSDRSLITQARNHWTNITDSSWPCTKKRPFCLFKRELLKEMGSVGQGRDEEKENKVTMVTHPMKVTKVTEREEGEEKENSNPKKRKTRK